MKFVLLCIQDTFIVIAMSIFVYIVRYILYIEGNRIMIYDLQKASMMKRISAFLLDFILMMMLFTGLMLVISSVVKYDDYSLELLDRQTTIQQNHNIPELEEKYEVKFTQFQSMTKEEINALPDEVRDAFLACYEEINSDNRSIYLFEVIVTLSLLIVSLSLLISFIILEFILPLIFKNGQTIGKKVFSIAVMRKDCVRIPTTVLFIRTILGKYTIGTMVPALMLLSLFFGSTPIMPLMVILLIAIIQVILLITTKTNSLIHDVLASTVVVDYQSQMIFDTVEALNEYKLRVHKENVDKAQY